MGELEEIRELLLRVLERLDNLERRIGFVESGSRLDSKIIEMYRSLLRAYASVLGSVARVERMAQLVSSDLDRSIIRVLANSGPMNISQVTEEVKRLRGSASRRIIAERLRRLAKKGIVERVKGKGKVYRLRYPEEFKNSGNA